MIGNVTTSAPGQGTATVRRQDNIDRDAWMRLLVTQMTRGQDPLNPMNPDQMAAQLAQFSSVEQLMNIREQLEALNGANAQLAAAMHGSSALNTLGRTVVALGDQFILGDDAADASVRASVPAPGGTGTLRVLDADGRVLGERDLGELKPGMQTLELGSAVKGLAPGAYRFEVEVRGADGGRSNAQTYTQARVEGIRHSQNGPVLTSGTLEIPLITVIEVLN